MRTFRILLADDHPVFRLGLCSLLGSHAGWEICGQASNGREAIEKCSQLKPDLLILDIAMPELNGVDAARRILRDNPRQTILVLSEVASEQTIRDCLQAGVRGWVYKSDNTAELTAAVESLQRQRSTFSSRVCDLILDGYLLGQRFGPVTLIAPRLSLREREVVLVEGLLQPFERAGAIASRRLDGGDRRRRHVLPIRQPLEKVVGLTYEIGRRDGVLLTDNRPLARKLG